MKVEYWPGPQPRSIWEVTGPPKMDFLVQKDGLFEPQPLIPSTETPFLALLVYVTSPCLIVPLFVRVSMLLPFCVKGAYTSRAVLLVGVLPYSLFCLCNFWWWINWFWFWFWKVDHLADGGGAPQLRPGIGLVSKLSMRYDEDIYV